MEQISAAMKTVTKKLVHKRYGELGPVVYEHFHWFKRRAAADVKQNAPKPAPGLPTD